MTAYHIRFALADGRQLYWTRFGNDMEGCLALTKISIHKSYGDEWRGNVAICGPQGESGVYNF